MIRKNFLQTYELSVEVIQMIADANEYCYLVTPYVKLWPQLERALEDASRRELFLTFIIREDSSNNDIIRKLNGKWGFEVVVVKDMHIKLYLTEKKAMISSMNLYDASQHRNLELGYITHQAKMVKKDIIENYIMKDSSIVCWSGKFQNMRAVHLDKVVEAKKSLEKTGYCVSCQSEIQLDGRPNAFYVQCRLCYFNDPINNRAIEEEQSTKVSFCHFCGSKHEPQNKNPFHEHCRNTVHELWQLIKIH